MIKTLVIYTEIPDEYPKIALLDGDLRRLNSIYVNTSDDENLEEEILGLFYKDGILDQSMFLELPLIIQNNPLKFDFIIHCGFAS